MSAVYHRKERERKDTYCVQIYLEKKTSLRISQDIPFTCIKANCRRIGNYIIYYAWKCYGLLNINFFHTFVTCMHLEYNVWFNYVKTLQLTLVFLYNSNSSLQIIGLVV